MQVRWVDQTQYPMIVVASLSAVPQSCRTPLPNQYLDCMLLAVYTHTHHLSHTTLSHTIFHTPTLSHTIFHTQLCHTLSFTHNFVTHYLSHTIVTHHLSHTTLSHTIFHTACMAGVALGDIHLRFAWQAWYLVTFTFVLRGRRGAYGTGLALVARLDRFSRR